MEGCTLNNSIAEAGRGIMVAFWPLVIIIVYSTDQEMSQCSDEI